MRKDLSVAALTSVQVHHNLRASFLFVTEHFVSAWCFVKTQAMTDDKRGINLPRLNTFQKRSHVTMRMGLAHFELESLIKGHSKIELDLFGTFATAHNTAIDEASCFR